MNERFPLLKFVIFGVVCLGFAAWIVSVIGNISLEDRVSYEAEFEDVTGLLVNDAVKVAGVTVGKVTGISLAEGGVPVVRFEVNSDVDLGQQTTAEVRWRDVFGLRFLYLYPEGDVPLEAGARLPREQTRSPADLGLLLQRLTPVMRALEPERANLVLEALSEALVPRIDEVRELIRDGASLTQALASREEEISRLLVNSATIVDAYAEREQELRGLLDSFSDVAATVAERNDVLENAITTIDDQQSELARLFEANDDELRGALDELDQIAAVLSVNHGNVEDIVTYSGRGLVSYHRISSIGQFFNINAVGVSFGYETVTTQRGASLPPRDGGGGDRSPGSSSALSSFFGSALALGGGR